ncbi:MAG: hypothetical protein HZC54_20175 [Verrucomicrobia bacterium]|nr:hypothetical protein [Verrucomicrobiota bacterium]
MKMFASVRIVSVVIVLCVFACVLNIYGQASGQQAATNLVASSKPAPSNLWDIWKIVLGGLVIVLSLLITILKLKKKRAEELRKSEIAAAHDCPLSNSKTDTIVELLRKGTLEDFNSALLEMTFLRRFDERVIQEISKIAVRADNYANSDYLTYEIRCKASRFLHLALERNTRFRNGRIIGALPAFHLVYNDCSLCKGLKERSRGMLDVFEAILKLLPGK